MNKSDIKIQIHMVQKFLNAIENIDAEKIQVDFYINMTQYEENIPIQITMFNEDLLNFTMNLYEHTDIKQLINDLEIKSYCELKEKYSWKFP